jgi:hypothetical protein
MNRNPIKKITGKQNFLDPAAAYFSVPRSLTVSGYPAEAFPVQAKSFLTGTATTRDDR